jgi:hypothetical protein
MSMERDPATVTGPQPVRPAYSDNVVGSEEQHARRDGGENVGASYNPGTVRPTGNLIFALVAVIAFLTLIGLYVLLMAMR